MKELDDIIRAYDEAILENKQAALATVVKVEGSSYRRPGARMLVTDDGKITGAISGGCLEGDALRKAQFAMYEQQNKLEIYDTTDEEDDRLGIQLGCNGIVYILFEPIKNDDANNPVNLLKKVAQQRKDAAIVTLFNLNRNVEQKGTVGFINETESFFSRLDERLPLKNEWARVLRTGSSTVTDYEGKCSALFQFIPPAIQLVIVGAGNDAQPLVDMSFLLGWGITVVDGRPTYATQQRFPKANKIVVSKAADILSAVDIDTQTAIVLMTHNYNYDIAALEKVIETNCRYIGVLGPKKKLNKMLDELMEKGVNISEGKMNNLYGPVGLDIGAETSEEIALSILAEIKATLSLGQGSSLKNKTTEIHKRTSMETNE
jgi:xanthine/CO dehydrogenase XdhC/CoxF family maturation factor